MVNNFIQRLPTNSLSETNTLVFAIAYTLTSKVTSPISSNHSKNNPPWKMRLQSKVKLIRKEISQLSVFEHHHSPCLDSKLKSKYHVEGRGLSAALVEEQRLLALSHRLRRYEARCEQYRQNRIFTSCPGKLYN